MTPARGGGGSGRPLAHAPELERALEALQLRLDPLPAEPQLLDLGIGQHVAGDDDVRSAREGDQARGEVDGGAEVVERAVLRDRDAGPGVDADLELERTAGDVTALAAALVRMLRDVRLRRRLGVAARKEVRERWTWPNVLPALLRTYAEAAK